MTTQDFKIKGNLNRFINFAAADPYYLEFSQRGPQSTISWLLDRVRYTRIEDGFSIEYNPVTQQQIHDQIARAVKAYHGQHIAVDANAG